jgi:hypothetical protein
MNFGESDAVYYEHHCSPEAVWRVEFDHSLTADVQWRPYCYNNNVFTRSLMDLVNHGDVTKADTVYESILYFRL